MKQHLGTGNGTTLCGRKSGFAYPSDVEVPDEWICKSYKRIASKS